MLKCFEGFADNMEDAFVCKINHQFILKVFFFPPKKRSKVDYSASVPHHRYYWRKKGVWKNPKGHETHGEITMSKCCREQPEVEYYFFCEDLSNNPWMMRLIANGKSAVREKLIYIYIYTHYILKDTVSHAHSPSLSSQIIWVLFFITPYSKQQ